VQVRLQHLGGHGHGVLHQHLQRGLGAGAAAKGQQRGLLAGPRIDRPRRLLQSGQHPAQIL